MNVAKSKLTAEIAAWLTNQIDSDPEAAPLIRKAFKTGKLTKVTDYFWQQDSLRLRSVGYKLLSIYFESHEFMHDRSFSSGEIIALSKYLNTPFYISEQKIIIFSDEQSVMCSLAGSVATWIKNLS